ncbi:MAG: PilN domain-containing protein [Fibrobacter sp.]|jgi:type IV pilus assembly protein PilN|nr:PilN domain-containing protein [Fibrobacter sp.]
MAKKKNKALAIEINLLPAEFRKTRTDWGWILSRRIIWSVIAFLAVCVAAFMLVVHVQETTDAMKNELTRIQAEVTKEKPLLNKIKTLDDKLAVIAQKNKALKSIQVNKKRWVILFENISSVIPPNMWLTNLSQLSESEMELKGNTFDFAEVAEYMVRLEQQISVSTVTLVSIATVKVGGEEAYSFTIKVTVKQDLGLEGEQ